jgi:hypothetical protein
MKTLSEGRARLVTRLWRPRFVPGAPLAIMAAALLLAGCTASQPVAYQQPVPRYYQYPVQPPSGGYYVHSPYGYDRYVAPSPYAQPVAPPPTYIPDVIPRAEAAEPYTPTYTPTPAAAPNPPPTYSPRPLPAVTSPPPASSDCGWWDPCHLWN